MKRFIDLRGQISDTEDVPVQFAFYCTVTDQFEEFGGEQTWTSRGEFIEDYASSQGRQLQRYLSLMPDWVGD